MAERYKEFFSWRTALVNSDLAAPTKHVLLTLSLHMNEYGEGCFPSTKTLERETSLSERSVITHIMLAVSNGWITKKPHKPQGKGWRRNEYCLRWPIGAEGGSVPKLKHGAERRAVKALKEVQSSTSL